MLAKAKSDAALGIDLRRSSINEPPCIKRVVRREVNDSDWEQVSKNQ